MTKYFPFLLIALSACNSKNGDIAASGQDSATAQKIFMPQYAVNRFEGEYKGSFDQGFITIVLNYVNGRNVSGYNLHKGMRRNINGTVQAGSGAYSFVLKEPGDNPFDGTFEFTIDTATFNLSGKWTPNDPSKTSAKTLALQKQANKSNNNMEDQLGTWVPASGTYSTDTTLDFSADGICEYKFYATPGDSTSQINSVKGNYIVSRDTLVIEWQKNAFTPAQKMKLVKKTKKIKNGGEEYEELQLSGHGWKFAQFQGD